MANRAPTLDPIVFSIRDLKEHGSKKLQVSYRDYYNEGAMDLITLRDNEEAYDRYKILPRVLRNVSQIDTSSEIFGQKVTFPLGLSPTAMQQLAHPEGELAASRAAANMGISMCLSSYSTTSLEEVKKQGKQNPYMIQMCVVRDRNITLQLLKRAEGEIHPRPVWAVPSLRFWKLSRDLHHAGYRAIFLSVDVPVLGRRLNEMRNKFSLPQNLTFPNILSTGHDEFTTSQGPTAFDDTLEWEEIIPWLKAHTTMQIWLKGVTSPADVELAIRYGVDGVVISNHGGRQLDSMPATLDSLRECAPVACGRIPLAVDGGIRRGTDIFKALALGAQHCFIGRIAIWGLSYNGQKGVELALKILLDELHDTMALAGCRKISDITRCHLSARVQDQPLAKL